MEDPETGNAAAGVPNKLMKLDMLSTAAQSLPFLRQTSRSAETRRTAFYSYYEAR